MKLPRFDKNEQPIENDLFDQLDAFLTDLIVDRAPVDARTGLSNWLEKVDKKISKATKSRSRSRKGSKTAAFATA